MIAKKLNTVVAFVDCKEGEREGLPGQENKRNARLQGENFTKQGLYIEGIFLYFLARFEVYV